MLLTAKTRKRCLVRFDPSLVRQIVSSVCSVVSFGVVDINHLYGTANCWHRSVAFVLDQETSISRVSRW